MAKSISLVLLNRKMSNKFILSECDYVAVWLQIVQDYESLTLRWCSHYPQPNCHCMLNHCSPSISWNYWQPIVLFYILYFASQRYVAPHYLSHHFMRDMSDKWCSHITFQRIWPAYNGMQTQQLIFDWYRLTVASFLIRLLFLDFRDLPWAIFEISTMWTRAKRRVVHLNSWMNAAWWLSCTQGRIALLPLTLWLVWHRLHNRCWYISSLI